MASPQLENGYMRLANELGEALARASLNGSQFRIVFAVIRECYGRNGGQKSALLSHAKLARQTGLGLRTVQRELRFLVKASVITRTLQPLGSMLGVQKDYDLWSIGQQTHRQQTDGLQTDESVGQQTEGGDGLQAEPKKKEVKKEELESPPGPKPQGEALERFAQFWVAYPRKVAKQDAQKAFLKINPDGGLLARMLRAVGAQRRTNDWCKDGGQFIPYPASWLRGGRWEDELTHTGGGKTGGLTQAELERLAKDAKRTSP